MPWDNAQSFLYVLLAAALAPIVAGTIGARIRGFVLPVVVVEIVLGFIIGPQGLGIAEVHDVLTAFSNLGLGFLFFFAGYEIRMREIKGEPLKLAAWGWILSLVLAYSLAGILEASGLVLSGLLTGTALATTAIGTLIPVLRDENLLGGNFGRHILAIGAVGEFGPILIVTILLTAKHGAAEQVALLIAFVLIALLIGKLATGSSPRWLGFVNARMENSGQLPVRLTVLLIFGLVIIAGTLGMDVILGAFAAGMILRVLIGEGEAQLFDTKMEAVGFGFLIPFFFIVSGMNLDLEALFAATHPVARLGIFFLLMLVVRGVPELLLYRRAIPREQRPALAVLASTQLPLVVAIAAIGLDSGEMRPQTAAALVTAAVLTVLVFPSLSLRLLDRAGRPQGTATTG